MMGRSPPSEVPNVVVVSSGQIGVFSFSSAVEPNCPENSTSKGSTPTP